MFTIKLRFAYGIFREFGTKFKASAVRHTAAKAPGVKFRHCEMLRIKNKAESSGGANGNARGLGKFYKVVHYYIVHHSA